MVRLAQALAGLTVGLLLAEGAFVVRDDDAFPHVNTYVPDETLAVRLEPDTRQRISFAGNPVTTLTVHDQGYRGPAWPPPGPGEVLVVGDSQVFGLGVEDHQTFSARLAAASGRTVLNGGVPTYGPDEYLAVAAEVMSARGGVDTLVLVINLSNDLFELSRPNRERHAEWDGWAVRIETAPETVSTFPGRRLLFQRSHLVYAARRWLHDDRDSSLPSEGSLDDIVAVSGDISGQRIALETAIARQRAEQDAAFTKAVGELSGLEELIEVLGDVDAARANDEDLKLRAVAQGSNPGDIVSDRNAEAGRSVAVTAELLREGAVLRRTLRERLRAYARTEDAHTRERIETALARGPELDPELARMNFDLPTLGAPFDSLVTRATALAAEHGAKLVVVALPVDLQVSEGQWTKYGLAARDIGESTALLDEIVWTARRRGAVAVDLLPTLREAGDEAFLHADLHLSAVGHQVVADRLAAALAAPAPFATPEPGMPEGRSRLPLLQEWAAVGENRVGGSTRNRCQTRQLREWLRVDCRSAPRDTLVGVDLSEAPTEAFAASIDGHLTVWTPVLPGREVDIGVHWSGRQETLQVRWAGEGSTMGFVPLAERTPTEGTQGPWFNGFFSAAPWPAGRGSRTATWFGSAVAGCLALPADTQRSCLYGLTGDQQVCAADQLHAGSAGWCMWACDAGHPCEAGVCTRWQGAHACL